MSPFFSIIIAAYNVENYIEEAVNSIISQTFKDWELIIIDDASTDGTINKIEKFTNCGKIKLIKSVTNSGGCFVPREIGAKASRGGYIVHLDGDDVLKDDHLQKLYENIVNEASDLVIPEMWRFEMNIKNAYKLLPKNNVDTSSCWLGLNLVKFTFPKWEIPMAGYAVRKEIFLKSIEEVKSITTECHLSDELQSRILLYLSGKVTFINSPYYYRMNPHSITTNKYGEALRLNIVNKGLVDFAYKYFGKDSLEFERSKLNFYFFLLSLYQTVGSRKLNKKQKDDIEKLLKTLRAEIDFQYYKDKISPHYFYSLKLPIFLGKPFFRTIQCLKRFYK